MSASLTAPGNLANTYSPWREAMKRAVVRLM
jgi:hypothetical protein